MIHHSMDIHVVKKSVEILNSGQTPIITMDKPLYAVAKQIQWSWPDTYGEDHFIVILGGLHVEMAALSDFLEGVGGQKHLNKLELLPLGQWILFSRPCT